MSFLFLNDSTRNHFKNTNKILNQAIEDKVSSGLVLGVSSLKLESEEFYFFRGNRREHPSVQDLNYNTSFDLSSVTKVVATTPLVFYYIERGYLTLDTPLTKFFNYSHFKDITIGHLLSHTSGLVAWEPYWEASFQKMGLGLYQNSISDRQNKIRNQIFNTPPKCAPGEVCLYSDLNFMLLGFICEEIGNRFFDELAEKEIFERFEIEGLRFNRTTSEPNYLNDEESAATERCPWRGVILQGQVHDDNCSVMGGFGGHAGCFGTAPDLILFVKKLFNRFFSSETLKVMTQSVSYKKSFIRSFGWDKPSIEESLVGDLYSRHSIGHWGFTGTSLWIDLQRKIVVTLLTNRVHYGRDNQKLKIYRPKIHDAVIMDLVSF